MTNNHRLNITEAGYNLSCLKILYDNANAKINEYNAFVSQALTSVISTFYLDTKVHDIKTDRDGKIEAKGTALMFTFTDVDGKLKTFVIDNFDYTNATDFLADMPVLEYPQNGNEFITRCRNRILEKFGPMLERFQVMVTYSSVWDGEGEITSDAYANMLTREVKILQTYDPDELLDEDGDTFECSNLADEYIEFADGTRKPCHEKYSVEDYDENEWDPSKDFWYN